MTYYSPCSCGDILVFTLGMLFSDIGLVMMMLGNIRKAIWILEKLEPCFVVGLP